MHKARENPNGSFSVGKTWNFEDLSIIESFTNRQPRNQEEAQQVQWAGDTGFTVTIIKPYFWNTNSTREKSFFIGSLAKVFKRYSGGLLPDLIGFTPAELDQIYAHIDRNSGAAPSQRPGLPPTPVPRGAVQRPLDSPNAFPNSQDSSPQVPPPLSARKGMVSQDSLQASPTPPPDSLRIGGLRPAQSREQVYPPSSASSITTRPPPSSSMSDNASRDATPDSMRTNSRRGGGFYQGAAIGVAAPPSRDGPMDNGLGISNRGANGDSNARGESANSDGSNN
jgi:exocyst complex component 1